MAQRVLSQDDLLPCIRMIAIFFFGSLFVMGQAVRSSNMAGAYEQKLSHVETLLYL